MKETHRVTGRITELEKERDNAINTKLQLENNLAKAYENGTDHTKILSDLSDKRQEILSIATALTNLDNRLYEVQREEHYNESKAVEEESHQKYEAAMKDIAKSLKTAHKTLAKYGSKAEADKTMERLIETFKEEIWVQFREWAAQEYMKRVPPMPKKPDPRDENGYKYEDKGQGPRVDLIGDKPYTGPNVAEPITGPKVQDWQGE